MASLITPQFERYVAEQTIARGTVQFDEFIFANIPGLNENNLTQHLTIPTSAQIVHRQAVSQSGVINENAVVYSVTIGTEVGDFDFNFIGLINRSKNLLAVAVQTDTVKKIRNKNAVQGNSITRNMLLEFSGAKALTGINVNANTWQIDFTVRLHGLDEKIRLTNRDLYGRAVFFDDSFLVKRKTGNQFTIQPGNAYVEGVRMDLGTEHHLTANSLPCSIYADVVHHCTVTGEYQTEIKYLTQSKADYVDTANRQHYVQILADIDSQGNVTDRRLLSPFLGMNPLTLDDTTENIKDKRGHTHKLPIASTIQRGITQLSSATNSNSETQAATSKAVKTAYDKAVEAKTTADGKVGLSGNESINGEKTFENRIVAKRNIRISDNPHYASYGDHLNIGANNGDCWFEYKSSNREIGTLRMHANGDFTYKRNKIYHEGAKPQFNTDIEDKPDTLAGYGIGDFKVEQGQGDANDYKTDGNYYLASGQNLPENGEWHIEVVSGGATNAVRQIARKANDNKIKTRFFNGSNWSEWKDASGDGVPIGAVVSFPRAVTNPVGFLRADGSTFSQQTFPDLYRTLGNHNQLPDLTHSDVGMTAYFAVDNIPAGWIAFDEIATQVTEQRYPELYRHLVGKYGSIERVPKVADRFLRNAGNSLSVGQTQEDELKRHVHRVPIDYDSWFDHSSQRRNNSYFDYTTFAQSSDLWSTLGYDNADGDNGFVSPKDTSQMATGGDETRPKSLILKLCIKALNSFDDVVFWIKSHGEVTNAGALDAGRLAQGLQDKAERNHTHTVSQITDFNSVTSGMINDAITYQNIGGWEVYKFSNGLMILTYMHENTDPSFNRNINDENDVITLMYPVAFTSLPVVSLTHQLSRPYFERVNGQDWTTSKANNPRGQSNRLLSSFHESNNVDIGLCYQSSNTQCQFTYTQNYVYISESTLHITAIGRWKGEPYQRIITDAPTAEEVNSETSQNSSLSPRSGNTGRVRRRTDGSVVESYYRPSTGGQARSNGGNRDRDD